MSTVEGDFIVKGRNLFLGFALVILTVAIAGCGHKLVSHGGETTVPVFPDKASFDKLKQMQNEGGPAAVFGGLGASLMSKKVDNGTPVKILTSDDEGSQIEVLDGTSKGVTGYVSKDSVD